MQRSEPVFAGARGRGFDAYEISPRRGRRTDLVALAFAVIAVGAIVANALFMQSGLHPSPIFVNKTNKAAPASKPAKLAAPAPQLAPAAPIATGNVQLPRPRPVESEPAKVDAPAAARKPAEIVSDIQKELARRGFYDGTSDGVYGPKTDAAIRDFEQAAGLKPGSEPSENLLRTITRSNAKAPAATNAVAQRPDPIGELISPSPNKRITSVQRALADYGYGQIKPTGALDRETQSAIEDFERGKKMPVTGQISPRLLKELSALSGRPLE
jgi:peptidoglycan hydrolase-like protein with peptidoglycan-binding domain